MADETTRVVVVDDHPLYRSGLSGVVDRMPDAKVVGEYATGDALLHALEATDHADAVRPHVVVLDLHMPGTDGVEVTRLLTARNAGVHVVVLTMLEDDGTVLAALAAGARGYLVKGADESEISAAIRIAAAGGAVLGPAVAGVALSTYRQPPAPPAPPFPQLSARESEVLELLARGRANQAIAAELHLTHQTVRNYVSSVFLKLGVADRAEAIVRAREAGIGAAGRR